MMPIITPNEIVPYLGGGKTFNPPVCKDRFTFMNDAQTPLWDAANKQWRVFALVNTNATYPKKTNSSNTFIGGNSGWGEWSANADWSNRTWLGTRIAPESLPQTGAIATGCVIPYKGKYYWYASTGNNISDVSLFISDTLTGTPVYQQVVLSGGGADFRDFDVQVQPDGSLTATISMGEKGIGFYSSPDGINWTYLSTYLPDGFPESLFECARMRTINGLTFLFFGANGWKNTDTNPNGDPAPRTYYSCGRWDGKTWTSGNIESVDFGSGFYGAVPFQNPETHEWFCISWCHTPDTLITMADGTVKQVKDIHAGEYVMGVNGQPRLVKRTFSGYDKMFRVTMTNGDSYTGTGHHTAVLKRAPYAAKKIKNRPHGRYYNLVQENGLSYVSMEELFNSAPAFIANHEGVWTAYEGNHIKLPVDPYYLGAWLGDGDTKNCNVIGNKRQHMIDAVRQYADELKLLANTEKSGERTRITDGVTGGTRALRTEFEELGIYKLKEIPEIYFSASREQRMQLLAGLLDTDAYLQNVKGHILFSFMQAAQRIKLVQQVKRLAVSLGFFVGKVYTHGNEGKWINITGNLEEIPTRYHKRIAPQNSAPSHHKKGIQSIDSLGITEYAGIEVDGDHLYRLGNGLITHNCSQWSFCANANHPYVEGEMQVYRLSVTGAVCNATVNFTPLWTDPDTQFRIPRENMNFTATGNFSPIQFGVVDRGWMVWRHWDKPLKNGVRICLGANGGEHNFSSDPATVAYGYQPKGFIMTKATDAQGRRGWNISTRGMGVPPEFDNKSYAATYFLPQPDGATDDEIWVWIDGGYCSVFAGDSRGAYNLATFTVNWLMGAIPWMEQYGIQIDSDGNIISSDSYPSSCRWWSDNFAQALCQGGQSYWDNIGSYKDAAEPDIRSSDGDNNYTLRIKKMVLDRTAATPQAGKGLLIQRTMNEPASFQTAVAVPTMPPAAGYVGVDNAIATYTPDENNSRARIIAVSKEDGKPKTGDYADSHYARPFVVRPDDADESKPSQTYFLLTSEQIYAMMNAMLVQTLQPSGEGSQNKGVVQFFWDAVNNKFVGKLRDGTMVSEK